MDMPAAGPDAVDESAASKGPGRVAVTSVTAAAVTSCGFSKDSGALRCEVNDQDWYWDIEQCPMCYKTSKSFHCKNCVSNGDFGHSSMAFDKEERFFEKQMKYTNFLCHSNLLKNDCTTFFLKRQRSILKKTETSILQEKITLLKLAISDKNKLITEKKNLLKKLKLKIEDQKLKVDRYEKRVVYLEDFTKDKVSVLNDKTDELNGIRSSLKNIIRLHIKQLVTHIFSLNVQPTILKNEEPDVNNSLSHTLEENLKLTYECDQWVDTCEEWSSSRQTELGYQIVAPILPAKGNYSAYNKWVIDKNRDYACDQTFVEQNPAYTISAALTYTSELVKQISFFLDVYLPKRPNFNDFCEFDETKFSKFVIHLNANILYLCFSQNVDPKLLHPDDTLKNVLVLLNTSFSDLGRVESPNIDSSLCIAYEDKIAFQLQSLNDDSDPEDDNYFEWEAVPIMEYPADHIQLSSQSASSVATTGLVAKTTASIVSIWHGLTKNN